MGSDKEILGKTTAATLDTRGIDRVFREFMRIGGVPGAAVAVVAGEQVYIQGYGVKEKGKDAPVTPDTLFANASTTKAVTTAAMALLVDAGKMAWDDPVRKHLPALRLSDPHADAMVTLRDLVSHRTGLPRHDMLWYKSPLTRDEVLARIGNAKLTAQPRALYQYQNICYAAAGEAVRAASGYPSFEAFVKERLLTPLGMARTNLSTHHAEADPDHAEPHQRKNGKAVVIPYLNFDNVGPAGTMNSCAREMVGWLRMQLSGGLLPDGTRLISEAALRETHTPQTVVRIEDATRERYPFLVQSSYGLGWSVQNWRGGEPMLSHGGAIDGFRAQVALLPGRRVGVVVFANLGAPFVDFVRNSLLDLLLGLEPLDWAGELRKEQAKVESDAREAEEKRKAERKGRKPVPVPLADFAGEYEDPAYGVAVVTTSDSKTHPLTLRWNGFETPLRHQTFTKFLTTGPDDAVKNDEARFIPSAEGRIVSLQLFDGTFARKETPAPTPSKA